MFCFYDSILQPKARLAVGRCVAKARNFTQFRDGEVFLNLVKSQKISVVKKEEVKFDCFTMRMVVKYPRELKKATKIVAPIVWLISRVLSGSN